MDWGTTIKFVTLKVIKTTPTIAKNIKKNYMLFHEIHTVLTITLVGAILVKAIWGLLFFLFSWKWENESLTIIPPSKIKVTKLKFIYKTNLESKIGQNKWDVGLNMATFF